MKSNNNQINYLLALSYIPNTGPITIKLLLEKFPDLKELFDSSVKALTSLNIPFIKEIKNPAWDKVEKNLKWAEKPHRNIITILDSNYPRLLQTIAAPPAIIFVEGNISLLSSNQLAIVGSRNPTAYGIEIAFSLGRELASLGIIITSGLALGIDGASHRGALEAQGQTIAVMGTGMDSIYPRSHHKLAQQIITQNGTLITEFPIDMQPKAENFPQRNRIISGLSLGTLVVEATSRSGSLITAKFALEQGREVFAVPGSIHNPLARGCHALLRQGAKLVENINDILEELHLNITIPKPINFSQKDKFTKNTLDIKQQKLLEYAKFEHVTLETLIAKSGFTTQEVLRIITSLEVLGLIRETPDGKYTASI